MRQTAYISLCFAWIVLLLAACEHDDDNGRKTDVAAAICFTSFNADENIGTRNAYTCARDSYFFTRAHMLTRGTPLEQIYDNFMVKTMKAGTTGATQSEETVMDNYTVRFDTEKKWYYDGIGGQYLKFWDLSASQYTFSAVTPIANNGAGAPPAYKNTTVEISAIGDVTISGVHGNLPSSSADIPDWMIARTVRRGINDADKLLDYDAIVENIDDNNDPSSNTSNGTSSVFQTPAMPSATVPLNFHHTMAKVDFRAYNTSGTDISITKFRVTIPDAKTDEIYNRGNFTTAEDAVLHTMTGWTDQTFVSDTDHPSKRYCLCEYDTPILLGTTSESASLLSSHMQIPQDFPVTEGRVLNVLLEADDGKTYTGTITLNAETNNTNSWLMDKHYTYVLKIAGKLSTEVILFEVTMDNWTWEDKFEETETNW